MMVICRLFMRNPEVLRASVSTVQITPNDTTQVGLPEKINQDNCSTDWVERRWKGEGAGCRRLLRTCSHLTTKHTKRQTLPVNWDIEGELHNVKFQKTHLNKLRCQTQLSGRVWMISSSHSDLTRYTIYIKTLAKRCFAECLSTKVNQPLNNSLLSARANPRSQQRRSEPPTCYPTEC